MNTHNIQTNQIVGWISQLQKQIDKCLHQLTLDHPICNEDIIIFVQEQYELLRLLNEVIADPNTKGRFTGVDVDAIKSTIAKHQRLAVQDPLAK